MSKYFSNPKCRWYLCIKFLRYFYEEEKTLQFKLLQKELTIDCPIISQL